ncbi:MAG: hypothetical protein D6748_10585 [Calditrichaeota bacterium]|nr:MAG: hypothetical protein D6748_10585 [Calditrichota bacterium]
MPINHDEESHHLEIFFEACKKSLETLRGLQITEDDWLQLEFFFYSPNRDRAQLLKRKLEGLGYTDVEIVEKEETTDSNARYLITGLTQPIQMSEEKFLEWNKIMVEYAEMTGCMYDGWGTLVG